MPITLTREDVEQLTLVIQNLQGFDRPEERRAILVGAFQGYPRGAALLGNLSLPDAPRRAADALLAALLNFGSVAPGKQALGILLRHLENEVGEQDATFLSALFSRYPLEATGDPPAGPLVPKYCNRYDQGTDFARFFRANLRDRPGAPQFCVIHGEEGECHNSLVDRLLHDPIEKEGRGWWSDYQRSYSFRPVRWPTSDDLEDFERKIRASLNEAIPQGRLEPDPGADAIHRGLAGLKQPIVVLRHTIDHDDWLAQTPEQIRRYVAYWSSLSPDAGRPWLVIFLNVVYQPRRGLLGWFRRDSPAVDREAIEETLLSLAARPPTSSCPFLVLKPLRPPGEEHVKEWLNDYTRYGDLRKQQLLRQSWRPGRRMMHIEEELTGIWKAMQQELGFAA